MRGNDIFPSKYIKAADLNGRDVKVTISRVDLEDLGDGHKPVIYFEGKAKGLVTNKTNWNSIAKLYGDESDNWEGKEIVIFPMMVSDLKGQPVEGIRVKAALPNPSMASRPAPPPRQVRNGDIDDEIPF